jgi:hypothetical protein
MLRDEEHALVVPVDADRVEGSGFHVCHDGTGWIHARINRVAGGRKFRDTSRDQVHNEDPAAKVEHRTRRVAVGRESHDPSG